MSAVMNYDPNLTSSGRMANQTVRLTFGQWGYRKIIDVHVGGNCTGIEVISCAVGNALESLAQDDFGSLMVAMVDESGNELHCSDDEDRREDWLGEMLVCAEIISIEKEG